MGKEIVYQVQEVQRVPYRINPRRNMPTHILIKLSKIKYKEKILKAALLSCAYLDFSFLKGQETLFGFSVHPIYGQIIPNPCS